jgi:peptidyl-prolyl cis-trans isomerase SurA
MNSGEKLTYTLRDLQQHIIKNRANFMGRSYADVWVNAFYADEIEKRLVDLSVKRFPEFKAQLERYKEGLAVFKITDENVWSGATVDSTKLMEMFQDNIQNYQLEEREYYHLISVKKDSSLAPVMEFVNEGNHPDSIRTYMSYVAVVSDSTNTFDGDPFDRLKAMDEGTFSEEFDYKNRKAVFYLNERLPARSMTFDEAFGRLLASYQPEREEKWLTELRKKYKVKPDPKKLEKAYKQEQNL